MNVRWWRTRNWFRKVYVRILHPWPFYKRVGGINAVVTRGGSGEHGKPGTTEELRNVSPVYGKRWGTGAGT
jgi:hypothetical protein